MAEISNSRISVRRMAVAGDDQATAVAVDIPAPAMILAGTSGGDGTAGIVLPPATKGKVYHVKNLYNGNISVYPASGNSINALTDDAAYTIGALKSASFIADELGVWYSFPLVAS